MHAMRCSARWMKMFALVAVAAGMALSPCRAQTSKAAEWMPLFDGKSLEGWKRTPFTGQGEVKVVDGVIELAPGGPMTGITRETGPQGDFELRFEAARINGNDFFASLTFPLQGSFCTWVTGGWGGDIVGISSIDGWDASENETRSYFNFENGRWYKFRVQVLEGRVRAWIDDQQVVNVDVNGRRISMRHGEIKLSAPLGFAAYNTRGRIRNIEIRPLGKRD